MWYDFTMESSLEEIELINQARARRREAYEELVRRHHPKILQLCLSLLKNASEAEDAAQDIFLKVYRSLENFRGESSFSTWLYRIASNHCMDILRRESRRKTESWDEMVEREGEKIHRLFAPSPDSSKTLEAADLFKRILSHLPEDYRLILTLRELQGLSYEEISHAMDCSLNSVKARLRRARQSLQENLRHFLDSESV